MNISNPTQTPRSEPSLSSTGTSEQALISATTPADVQVANAEEHQHAILTQTSSNISEGGEVSPPSVGRSPDALTEIAKKDSPGGNDWLSGATSENLMGFIMSMLAKVFGIMLKTQTSSQQAYYSETIATYKTQMAAADQTREASKVVLASTIAAGVVGVAGVGVSAGMGIKSMSEAKQAHTEKIQLSKLEDTSHPTESLAAVGSSSQGVSNSTGDGGDLSVDLSKQRSDLKLSIDQHVMKSEHHATHAELSRSSTSTATALAQGVGESEQKKAEAKKQELDAEGSLREANARDQDNRRQKMQGFMDKAAELQGAVINSQREITRSATR